MCKGEAMWSACTTVPSITVQCQHSRPAKEESHSNMAQGMENPSVETQESRNESSELISITKSQKAKYYSLFLMFLGNSKVEKLVDSSGGKKIQVELYSNI